MDTRADQGQTGAFGPPALAAYPSRVLPITTHPTCHVPPAAAYSLNVTVVPPGPLSFLTVWPAGTPYPNVSTLNDPLGTIIANAAIVPSGDVDASIQMVAGEATDIIIDINGYYATPTDLAGNTAIGTALNALTTGVGNTDVGANALANDTSGINKSP